MRPSGRSAYSFQDLVVIRTASALYLARISKAKILAALERLRASRPPGALLGTLAIGAAGSDVVVNEGADIWVARTEQHALQLDSEKTSSTAILHRLPRPIAKLALAEAHYARAHSLEDSDVRAARQSYLDALAAHSGHLEARINLGRLLHLQGELTEAERVYRGARTAHALLSFNLGNLLEDLERQAEAIEAYHEALAQDPGLFDAHFNLSRLYESVPDPRRALRHLLAYRRHVRSPKG
jgi:tetratricopeptide (TPR) repeat protein